VGRPVHAGIIAWRSVDLDRMDRYAEMMEEVADRDVWRLNLEQLPPYGHEGDTKKQIYYASKMHVTKENIKMYNVTVIVTIDACKM